MPLLRKALPNSLIVSACCLILAWCDRPAIRKFTASNADPYPVELNWDKCPSGVENCETCTSLKGYWIYGVREYCRKINKFASHCATRVDIFNGYPDDDQRQHKVSALVEQESGDGDYTGDKKEYKDEYNAFVGCTIIGYQKDSQTYKAGGLEDDDISQGSVLFERGRTGWNMEENEEWPKSELEVESDWKEVADSQVLDGYEDKGWDEGKTYAMTLQGLHDWSYDYLQMYPAYQTLTTNCQQYSIGVYNAVSHSNNKKKQWISNYAHKMLSNKMRDKLGIIEVHASAVDPLNHTHQPSQNLAVPKHPTGHIVAAAKERLQFQSLPIQGRV